MAGLPQRTPDGLMLANGVGGTVRVLPWIPAAEAVLAGQFLDERCSRLTPALSLVPGVVITTRPALTGVAPSCGYYAWDVTGATPTLVDSIGLDRPWSMAYLGPDRWFVGGKQGASLNLSPLLTLTQEPDEFVVNPAGGLIVPNLAFDRQDIPVFSTATASVAYRITGRQWSMGAGFSPGGDTLFLAARDTGSARTTVMLAVDPLNGQVLKSAPLDTYAGGYLVVPPAGRWMYLTGSGRYPVQSPNRVATVAIQVIDRQTLAVVGHLQVPLGVVQPDVFDIMVPMLGTNNRLFVVAVHAWDGPPLPTLLYEFGLAP
jgi:hypothetical protein